MATMRPPRCSERIRAILSSGVASARKSSTPASAAMAAAVRGLSPVIITVRMPRARSWSNRSVMPSFTTSTRATTPRASPPSATTRGVPPPVAMPSTMPSRASGTVPPCSLTQRRTESVAPLRTEVPARSTPLMRVWAVKGTRVASLRSRSSRSNLSLARTTIDRPSGVSSARLANWAAAASRRASTPGSGRKSAAWRLPRVMVPVLSSRRVEQSPAASTARPDMASTLCWTRRSMPAIPMADSSAPMVVGIRQTSRATRTMMSCSAPE